MNQMNNKKFMICLILFLIFYIFILINCSIYLFKNYKNQKTNINKTCNFFISNNVNYKDCSIYPIKLKNVLGIYCTIEIKVWTDIVIEKKVRLHGINIKDPYNASLFIKNILNEKKLYFVSDFELDSSDRMLGTIIWYENKENKDICKELLSNNYAVIF